MASIITGLFKSQTQARKISEDLEQAGFASEDFIIYLQDKNVSKEVKTSIWQSFFRDQTKLEDDSLVVSVRVRTMECEQKTYRIFEANGVIRSHFFENIRFRDAMSLQFLKRIVSLRAKSQIARTPEVRHHEKANGMNAEVTFGKT